MPNAYSKAVCFGIIAGMRSMSAPALISDHYAKEQSPELDDSWLIASPITSNILKVMAAGELAADKSSIIPNRTDLIPLVFRATSGAVCGATICKAERERLDVGAIAGGLAAVLSAHACFFLRRKLTKQMGLPDLLVALAEDAFSIGFGKMVMKG